MKICAVICEYNPIHYGHIHQLSQARALSGCDTILCLMSGNFVQRGEPAITDKHTRAKTAILAGADIVIELPTPFALGCAELFASGAIAMLNLLKVDALCFGSECGNIITLTQTADILNNETPQLSELILQSLKSGISYPKSRELAFNTLYPQLKGILSSPNNILAVEYIRALMRTNSRILPLTIRREGSGYHDLDLTKGYPSSTAIRHQFSQANTDFDYAPEEIRRLISRGFTPLERVYSGLSALIVKTLSETPIAVLGAFNDATSDIATRAQKAAAKLSDYNAIISTIKNKSITMARVKRFLLNMLIGTTKSNADNFLSNPDYYNILGIKNNSIDFLKRTDINIIVRYQDLQKTTNPAIKDIIELDKRAAMIYSAISGQYTSIIDKLFVLKK